MTQTPVGYSAILKIENSHVLHTVLAAFCFQGITHKNYQSITAVFGGWALPRPRKIPLSVESSPPFRLSLVAALFCITPREKFMLIG